MLTAGGCGTGDDRDQAAGVVERFYDALRADDGAGACRQLSAAAVAQLESRSGRSCASVVTRLPFEGGAVVKSEVFVTSARVQLRNDESAFLDREPTGWKLTAVGCRAEDGKPRHRPLDCELEA